ncbi:hypothetical protein Tsubulata_015280 [Turnera subulata]|uniref:Sphingomyelin phosphodiesterase 4 n=1 Tax=Turnera subulata TaxID=218843 RepID=A0A9Q0FHH4_9ROSI|nr:hypothetical protein Tsubulata_015280 [Turnera subulata]
MHPHSYTVDSLSKSQDLSAAILSSSTPPQISAACDSISSFLHSHPPDHPSSRHFFSLAFPSLICRLYGFDDTTSSAQAQAQAHSRGWIDTAFHENDPTLASRLFSLLSPNGVLFRSISAVDRQSLVKYVFPIERLPEWARFAISSSGKDCEILNVLCPFLKGKIKEESSSSIFKGASIYRVELNVFEYFVFWFAYYPICRANSENVSNVTVKRTNKFKLENWASSIRGFSQSKRGNEEKLECNLYLRLLYAYLRAFVPVYDLGSHQPYRSSLLHYAGGNDGSVLSRAEFFVDTLVNYWLVDSDFSPLPVNVCKSFGLSFEKLRSVLGETPPTANLGEVVNLLVKYLNLNAITVKEGFDHVESPKWSRADAKSRELAASVNSSLRAVGSWNALIQRPVYRFILRSLILCPVGTSIKNASQIFYAWVSYMEPWNVGLDDFAELDAVVDGSGKDVRKEDTNGKGSGYSSLWQGYVLSNYLYYSSLVMHFIGFAHKFLHTDPEVIVQMVLKVIQVLTSSKELTVLVKNVDTVFHSKQVVSGSSTLNNLYRCVPFIREQLQDWEDGLSESNADGSFLHENWNKDLRLFSDGEDGGQQLLQLFILRAEAELQAYSGENIQLIDALKREVSCLFGGHVVKPVSFMSEMQEHEQTRDEIFKPRRVGNQALAGVKYKGDWMKRPVSDDEVAWLAKALVWLSSWLNEHLGLNQAESTTEAPEWSYVDVSSDVRDVCGPAETMKMAFSAFSSWLLMLVASIATIMRKHGLRVNLRILASKKIVMCLLVYTVFSLLKKVFGLLCRT